MDRKRSWKPPAVVTPEKTPKKPRRDKVGKGGVRITADMGNETFTFGQHRGKTFEEIAASDPDYHVRYTFMLKKKGEVPKGTLAKYIAWFNASGRVATPTSRRPSRATRYDPLGDERFPMGLHRGQPFGR